MLLEQTADERTLAALLDFSGRLAAAPTVEAVAGVMVEDGCGAVGARGAALALLDGAGSSLRVIAAAGTAAGQEPEAPAADLM
ncbi:MAG TPA: hypothetical protein VK911_09580, partial [Vicinamibacterales bacterium]|nr:hypothetical protein [Vicinamibacterales bacterium]